MLREFLAVWVAIICCSLAGCGLIKSPTHTPSISRTSQAVMTGAAVGAVAGASGGVLSASAGAVIGGVAGGFIGYDVDKHVPAKDEIAQQLRHVGIQIIEVGEDTTLVVPSDSLFFADSPRLKTSGVQRLKLIAAYLRHYPIVSAKVGVHTEEHGVAWHSLALSRQRAKEILEQLEIAKVDVRLLVGVGYGASMPVSDNTTAKGRAANRRVEIIFRRAVRPDV